MKKSLFFFFLFFFCPLTVFSEPGETIKALMADSVSMLDWGLYRAENHLNDTFNSLYFKQSKINAISNTYYDWDKNRIKIEITTHYTDFLNVKSENNARIMGKFIIDAVRQSLNIDPKTGNPFGSKNSLMESFFRHKGYNNKISKLISKEIPEEIDKMTRISTQVFYKTETSWYMIQCKIPLLGKDIYFSKAKPVEF